jgi:hypothetical protein
MEFLFRVRSDQRKPAVGVEDFAQVRRGLRENRLQGGPHVSLAQMAREGRAVTPADYNVKMQGRGSVRRQRNVAQQGGHFYLFLQADFFVRPLVPIEILELNVAQGSNCADLSGRAPDAVPGGRRTQPEAGGDLTISNVASLRAAASSPPSSFGQAGGRKPQHVAHFAHG